MASTSGTAESMIKLLIKKRILDSAKRRFVAAYNLLDATLMIFVGAIKGAGDTRFLMCVSLVMAVLLAGLSWLAVEVLQLGLYGCWALITAWIWLLGVIFLRRFLQGYWRDMRVIEPATAAMLTESTAPETTCP